MREAAQGPEWKAQLKKEQPADCRIELNNKKNFRGEGHLVEIELAMAAAENDYSMLKNIGGSLPVENVQWLAASGDQSKIPERYVRPEMQVDHVLNGEEDGELPVIDMSRLLHIQHSQEEVMKLGLACQEWGFFQLMNHGVSEEVIERMKCEIQGFFQLPLEEKTTYAQKPGSVEGYGQAFVLSEDQKLDWGDMYFLVTQPPFSRNLEFWEVPLLFV